MVFFRTNDNSYIYNSNYYCLFQAGISRDKVIPLYGRGGEGKDPREKVPPRPQVSYTDIFFRIKIPGSYFMIEKEEEGKNTGD